MAVQEKPPLSHAPFAAAGGGILRRLLAHYWTVAPRLLHGLRPEEAPGAEPWSTTLQDPRTGTVRLTGLIRRREGPGLLLVVHGLGGSAESFYALRAARAAEAAGLSCLRLNLRGAALDGEDFYNAGLVEDLQAALASPEVRGFDDVYILGYSLGGHLALRWACLPGDGAVRAVAAVSSPLDLERCAAWIDRPAAFPYRRYLLDGLFRIYERVARRRPVPLPPEEVRKIRGLRAFDEAVVAPRFGFAGASDYYARMSAGPLLPALRIPAILAWSPLDPMVPPEGLLPFLPEAPRLRLALLQRGGHVGVPADLDLRLPGPPGLENQLVRWLLDAGRGPAPSPTGGGRGPEGP
ncbi:MAG: alpha/beta fold hydrolase [Acidobacteriota bacterium]